MQTFTLVGVSLDFSTPYPPKAVRTVHLIFSLVAYGLGIAPAMYFFRIDASS
jgi:hypothetical protein